MTEPFAGLRDEIIEVLAHRNANGKLAVARDCAACPVRLLPIIAALVRHGYLVWIDRCAPGTWGDPPQPFAADIYRTTPDGEEFCARHKIGTA